MHCYCNSKFKTTRFLGRKANHLPISLRSILFLLKQIIIKKAKNEDENY